LPERADIDRFDGIVNAGKGPFATPAIGEPLEEPLEKTRRFPGAEGVDDTLRPVSPVPWSPRPQVPVKERHSAHGRVFVTAHDVVMGSHCRSRPIRVMLVEDNGSVRRAVASILNATADLEVCAEAATVAEAGPTAKASSPDVVIVDLRLPDGNGVEVGRNVRADQPETRVLLLTSASEEEALVASVLAGASAFMVKQVLGNDLVGTVRALAHGERLIDPHVGAAAVERLQKPSTAPVGDDARILRLVIQGRTNRQIGLALGLDETTVKARVASIVSQVVGDWGCGRLQHRNPGCDHSVEVGPQDRISRIPVR
jgi:DNA-binding NarL/FixJ family response regulator